MKEKIVIILGQTATGKSTVSLKLASNFSGEIINADSMQIYKNMDIGTCKLSQKERKEIPHHLFDILNPDEDYNAAMFVGDASKAISEIIKRGNLPILAGGTGLYIRCLLGGLFKFEVDTTSARKQLLEMLKETGIETLYSNLKKIDPEAASKIKPGDKQRILRALEIYNTSGMKISKLQKTHSFNKNSYNYLKIGLKIDKEELKEKIRARVEHIFTNGLLEEVETLLKKGYKGSLKALNSIGYREAVDVLNGKSDISSAKENTYKRTRDYAKRQMTWFKKDKEIQWFHPDDLQNIYNSLKSFI